MMSDFDYDSEEFEINIDDPDPVVESSEGYEDLETPMNITPPPPPPQTIDIGAEDENNNMQNEEANVNDTADDESDSDEDGLVLPQRKNKESAPVWTIATKIVGGGAKCNVCRNLTPTKLGCSFNRD